ncbi:exodeoxyribonuclease V subunit gamma [Georgenia alba]|uniref:RecBCD enzyme subunit RecC n=1 Tax=Georgenia alba TaxID=2233858 RepID=A0ABW2Q3N5_9MICO
MLHLHRSERADALVAPLAALLAEPPEDPFTPDVVAVPTRGVERWLAQRLSHHLGAGPDGESGVCANVTFDSPRRLVAQALASAVSRDPDDDPWRTDRLTWPLLEVLDATLAEPWAAPVARYLGQDDDPRAVRRGRRLSLARHLARLFAGYSSGRPDLVRAWAAGSDEDGAGSPLPPDLAWQAELWRHVRDHLGVPGPAEQLTAGVEAIEARPDGIDLPARLSVFGPTRLPEDQLRVLVALAEHRDVHLWLPHPSPVLWDRVAQTSATSRRRRDQPMAARHPILASMARDTTELQRRLTERAAAVAHHHPAPDPPENLLGALQQRLRRDDPEIAPHVLAPGDRSVQVHACYGLTRQVEVLREVLAGLFADDPTLEPRDVIVMCPNVEAVAPLVTATFGLAVDGAGPDGDTTVHPGHRLRVRLADRGPGQTNPALGLLSDLLRLADGRVSASDVLDLAASEPVRRRFGFADDDIDRIREWSVAAGVHWGEDLERRARFGLPELRQGTWDVALDRILLGAAMAEEDHRFVGPALPMDDVDSTDIDLAGRLAELLDRLADVLDTLDGARPLAEWLDALDRALTLLAETSPAETWQLVQARRILGDVRTGAETHEDVPLRLPDLRALLAGRLEGRPTRSGFRTGALTICSMEPMRAVPHRVVCLLGVDDGVFPRSASTDGDDVLLRDPCVGERDRRSEDRQLFLDAVTAAEEHLVVLYSGADERTGAARPPAVPVGELLDALDVAATSPDGGDLRDRVLVRHPLQVVDERNFTPGVLGRPGPFSFDAHAHAAARAGRGGRAGTGPFLAEPLPAEPCEDPPQVDLDDLIQMLEHPVKWFLRHRLRISLAGEVEDVEDRLPLTLDPLTRWQIGDRMLAARLARVEPERAFAAEWRRGQVPPKQLGYASLNEVKEQVIPIGNAAVRHAVGEASAVDVATSLPDGTVLTGTVPGVHETAVVRAVFSKLGPKHRIRAWVQLLALAAGRPGRQWTAHTVGRPLGNRSAAAISHLTAPGQTEAAGYLAELVTLRDLAAREPLPIPVGVAAMYAKARFGGDSVDMALRDVVREWDTGFERKDDYHELCWGPDSDLNDILGTPTAEEQASSPEETSRLGVLARRVWHPLLAHERTEIA